jgi:hypothetical protein
MSTSSSQKSFLYRNCQICQYWVVTPFSRIQQRRMAPARLRRRFPLTAWISRDVDDRQKSGLHDSYSKPGRVLLSVLLILATMPAHVWAGAQTTPSSENQNEYAPLIPEELDGLVAPIALYPDALVTSSGGSYFSGLGDGRRWLVEAKFQARRRTPNEGSRERIL